jgi:uncharacterized protein
MFLDRSPLAAVHAPLHAALLAAALLLGAAAAVPAPASAQPAARVAPQPTLPKVDIQAGLHVIRAEVAADGTTRMFGLMMRERLGPNEGMLFVFDDKAAHCFWMRNTLLPLSIAFIEDDGSIVNIADMAPKTEDSHCPTRPVRYALEMEQGWFAKRGLQAGSKLVQPRFFKAPARN